MTKAPPLNYIINEACIVFQLLQVDFLFAFFFLMRNIVVGVSRNVLEGALTRDSGRLRNQMCKYRHCFDLDTRVSRVRDSA